MASKSAQEQSASNEDVEELLDTVDKTLERIKTLYEQYFLGMQKQPPTFLHTDLERKLRDLAQLQIRNTGLRYRLATIQQKFGSYNSYWKRTLRQIENGTYLRNLSKIGRDAIRTGAEIPEEILAAMPKRMREQVIRDREQAIAIAQRRKLEASEDVPEPVESNEDSAAMISESAVIRQELKTHGGAHVLDEADADFDIDAFFESVVTKDPPGDKPAAPAPAPKAAPAPAQSKPAAATQPIPRTTVPIPRPAIAPSQVTRPNPIAPGAAAARGPVEVDEIAASGTSGQLPPVAAPPRSTTTIPIPKVTQPVPKVTQPMPKVTQPLPKPPAMPTGPLPRPQTTGSIPRPAAAAPPVMKPPPGMTEADVNVLYQNYVQANQAIGKNVGPDGRAKLLKTMNAQAPKIMEQYKAKGVDFTVVVKDNQVVLRAKPKT